MNITTFNDIFEAPILSSYPRNLWDQWKNAPLFEHTMDINKSIDDENEHLGEDLLPLPYPLFRANMTVNYRIPELKVVQVDYFVRESEGKSWQVFYYPRDAARDPAYRGRIVMIGLMTASNTSKGIELMGQMFHPKLGKWMSDADYDKFEGVVDDRRRKNAMYQVYCVLRTFSVDAMSDAVHTAQVSPNKPSKSIEWVKARTHYTLIYHGHPANTKNLAEGSNVTVDRKEQLTRMAHNRRAHYKTLKHERFRYARGKRIFVKASWVGPKEWKDEGGHQIYKILEEVK
jgi:hypothetical protein